MLDDFLLNVNKPARYIGKEWNIPRKDFTKAYIRVALSFPDLYEIGMSNLGIRILYSILNNLDDVSCERIFSCAADLEEILRSRASGIFSLETRSRLGDFDIVGFSLGSELAYTNVLNILELAGLPLKAKLRDHNHPLVIAGGPCALNPEPMHDFFDLFIIGEAEEVILEFMQLYRQNKERYRRGKISKDELLFVFSQLEGVYAPSLYEARYSAEGVLEKFAPRIEGVPARVKKRTVGDLNSVPFPLDWLVPYIQIVHDRITLEIMRGCANRCRFCQARSQYFPFRTRDKATILNLASDLYKRSGYEEISLTGLSVSDHPQIQELIRGLVDLFKARAVSISLPSLKAKSLVGNISSLVAAIKKTGLTFAPEAGTDKLRRIIGKDFQEDELFVALREAYRRGYQHVKLYFMTGLPGEESKDLDAIIDLAERVSALRREVTARPAEVNISINTLIPKPHTPLQWLAMEGIEAAGEKQDYLRRKTRNKRLKLNFHDRYMSFIEGVFSRGDRRLSEVVYRAFSKGARFDNWGNYFSFQRWSDAFKEAGIDPRFYLKVRKEEEPLPWDFLDIGIAKEALLAEFNKSIEI